MKFSEMNTNQLAKAICSMANPLSRIAQSKDLNEALTAFKNDYSEDQTVLQKMSGLLSKIVPALLCTHYDDVVSVVSVMTGKSVEEINTQNAMQTIAEVKSFIDEDFADFFTMFVAEKREK